MKNTIRIDDLFGLDKKVNVVIEEIGVSFSIEGYLRKGKIVDYFLVENMESKSSLGSFMKENIKRIDILDRRVYIVLKIKKILGEVK